MDLQGLTGLDDFDNTSDLFDENTFFSEGDDHDTECMRPDRTARSRIEIMRELIELNKRTDEHYDIKIFD